MHFTFVAEILQTSQVMFDPHGEDSLMSFSENPRKLLGFTLQTAPKLLDCPDVSYKYTYAYTLHMYIYILRALHT